MTGADENVNFTFKIIGAEYQSLSLIESKEA